MQSLGRALVGSRLTILHRACPHRCGERDITFLKKWHRLWEKTEAEIDVSFELECGQTEEHFTWAMLNITCSWINHAVSAITSSKELINNRILKKVWKHQ